MNRDIESKYLSRFADTFDLKGTYNLKGNRLLVERILDPERTTKSGIILDTGDNTSSQFNTIGSDKPLFFIVLDIGEGYTDDDGNISQKDMDVSIGDIIMLPKLSVKYFSIFGDLVNYVPDTIGIARESDIEIRFSGIEGYEAYFKTLNSME